MIVDDEVPRDLSLLFLFNFGHPRGESEHRGFASAHVRLHFEGVAVGWVGPRVASEHDAEVRLERCSIWVSCCRTSDMRCGN
jgi:hypothetical protein